MTRVRIRAGAVELVAELNDSHTAQRLVEALPIRSSAQVWGHEVYFSTGLSLPGQNLTPHAPPGAVAYWPPGKAICLFFGQKPAGPVELIGELRGDPWQLADVKPGDEVLVEIAEEAEAKEGPGEVSSP